MVIRLYLAALQKYPMLTQCTSTGVLCGVGDIIAQVAVERKSVKELEAVRTIRFAGYGLFITGPILRTLYLTYHKYIKAASAQVKVLKTVLVDQCLFAPTFLGFFVYTMSLLQGSSLEGAKQRVQSDYKPILLNNYKIWPAVQLLNFYVVPLQHRVLVVNTVAVGWNTYLAFETERGKLRALKSVE